MKFKPFLSEVAKHGPTGLYRGALPLILGSSGKQAARWTGVGRLERGFTA